MISDNKCAEIISKFNLSGRAVSCASFGSGHINRTYLLELIDSTQKSFKYVLQSVNTAVFDNIYAVMDNIKRVTEYLKSKSGKSTRFMRFLQTDDGNTFYVDRDKNFWRIYEFIDNSICLDVPENSDDFYQCALAFGKFQHDLADFPAESLNEIIPDFHNTPKRYETFLGAVQRDKMGRAASVLPETEFIKARSEFYSVLTDRHNAGALPLRVSHNDTKCNNVLLDSMTRKALCVIDLDTIMPGFSVTDFGDAVRFGASTAAEDETDLSKVHFDIEKFRVYTKGFLDGCGGLLTESEIMLLPEGAKMMTAECGMRFLTDYLDGDTYFKTEREGQNLDRCRTQLKLVAEMEEQWDSMKDCVKSFI